jgi:hypothetical protein
MTEFRKFTDQREYSGDPVAKLYDNGRIRFNKIAGQRWFQDCDHVEIFVSDGVELGFKPAPETAHGTYKYVSDGEYAGNVSIRSALANYGLWHDRMDESVAVPVRYEENQEMVVVDLSEPISRWSRSRSGGL